MKTARRKSRSSARRDAIPAVAAAHLPSESELRRIAERVLKFSDADETEVDISVNADALTRFANNAIHQNVAELSLTVSVRTVFGGRTARATTNKTDEESLRRCVLSSGTLARSQPKDPDLLPMPRRQKYAKVARFDAATAGATPAAPGAATPAGRASGADAGADVRIRRTDRGEAQQLAATGAGESRAESRAAKN